MRVQVIRNGQTTVNLSPSYTFSATTAKYNFSESSQADCPSSSLVLMIDYLIKSS